LPKHDRALVGVLEGEETGEEREFRYVGEERYLFNRVGAGLPGGTLLLGERRGERGIWGEDMGGGYGGRIWGERGGEGGGEQREREREREGGRGKKERQLIYFPVTISQDFGGIS
jgi:hypothetical protein